MASKFLSKILYNTTTVSIKIEGGERGWIGSNGSIRSIISKVKALWIIEFRNEGWSFTLVLWKNSKGTWWTRLLEAKCGIAKDIEDERSS